MAKIRTTLLLPQYVDVGEAYEHSAVADTGVAVAKGRELKGDRR
jgi:hypothetical protein